MINPARQELFFFCVWEGGWGLVEMAFWLEHANFNLPERQAAKLNFFAPYSVICSVCLPILAYLPAFLDTGLPRGNVHERDSGPMRGAIPIQPHNL